MISFVPEHGLSYQPRFANLAWNAQVPHVEMSAGKRFPPRLEPNKLAVCYMLWSPCNRLVHILQASLAQRSGCFEIHANATLPFLSNITWQITSNEQCTDSNDSNQRIYKDIEKQCRRYVVKTSSFQDGLLEIYRNLSSWRPSPLGLTLIRWYIPGICIRCRLCLRCQICNKLSAFGTFK